MLPHRGGSLASTRGGWGCSVNDTKQNLFIDLDAQINHESSIRRAMQNTRDEAVQESLAGLLREIQLKVYALRKEATRFGWDTDEQELVLSNIAKNRTKRELDDANADEQIEDDYPVFKKFRKAE